VFALALVAAIVVWVGVWESASVASPPVGEAPATPPGVAAGASDDAADVGRTDGRVTVDDGILPDGVSVFDDGYPGIARLSPDLLDALRRAARDAATDGITVHVNSGWRSAEYQDQLLQEAVSDSGSEAEAARWVATADTSAHVAGQAVDVGAFDAAIWMSQHGAAYGLCQTYSNESWHYELRPDAITSGCPAPYADPTEDPRMQ
jgi:hypothetical protein